MANEDFSGFWHLRETRALRKWVCEQHPKLVKSSHLSDWLKEQPASTRGSICYGKPQRNTKMETGDSETPSEHFIEWLAEWGRDFRRQQRGMLLTTAHSAKGLEFDHVLVLDGAWNRISQGEDPDATRRLYYVAMTRARQTLTLMRTAGTTSPPRRPTEQSLNTPPPSTSWTPDTGARTPPPLLPTQPP